MTVLFIFPVNAQFELEMEVVPRKGEEIVLPNLAFEEFIGTGFATYEQECIGKRWEVSEIVWVPRRPVYSYARVHLIEKPA
jgi:hypothetical protein